MVFIEFSLVLTFSMVQSNLYKLPAKYWKGKISIGYGIGYFEGAVGDNYPHRHHAHQLSFAKEEGEHIQVVYEDEDKCIMSSGVYIAANTSHHLRPGNYCSIYIDQTHFLADVIQHYLQGYLKSDSPIWVLPESLVNILREFFLEQNHAIESFQKLISYCSQNDFKYQNIRARQFSEYLILNNQKNLTVKQIAAKLNISESRFSHWFSENFGISYRSYRKWIRLLQTLQAIEQDVNLTSIAHQSHFADQPHFSRTCKQMFGIQPSLLKFIPFIEQMPILVVPYKPF